MPTDHIVVLLIAERDKLNAAIEALQGTSKTAATKKPTVSETTVAVAPRKKRHVSAGARKRMAEGQKKRWAAIKSAK
jgi:hypothetical protein